MSLGADMRRREFISVLGGAAAAWPLAARAQQPAMPVIGYFSGRSPDAEAPLRVPFLKALANSGFTVGRDVGIEYRFSEGHDQRLPALAAELVRRQVTMLVATDGPSAVVAKAATATTPIVFTSAFDPVQTGLVASFNRPGGNATGIHVFGTALGGKRLDLLRQLVPNARLVAFIVSPNNPSTPFQISEAEAAAQTMGLDLLVLTAANEGEIDKAFATVVERKAGAILYGTNTLYQVLREQLVALAARHRVAAMYEWREFVTAGGLMSYNTDRNEFGRLAGSYAGRILKGEKPADLPVVQSSRFEFVINLKTANALGIEVPPTLLARADEVIE